MLSTPQVWQVDDFEQWRTISRWLLLNDIAPADIVWVGEKSQLSLLVADTIDSVPSTTNHPESQTIRIPPAFLTLAEQVACHHDDSCWSLLYTALWRLTHGERYLLELNSDDLTRQLNRMQKQVTRDCHKMKAFVRFTKVADQPHEIFVAWYQPDHNVLRLVAPFFSRRFKEMDWTILTPYASAHWNGRALQYGIGVDASQAPTDDLLVEMWRDYYRSIFNPARIKVAAMKREMPVRFWKNLPEAATIQDLLSKAPATVQQMHQRASELARTARDFIPPQATLPELRAALASCAGCDLCQNGTRAVPSDGPVEAQLMIVGEQPGDFEEQQGIPFVGPAGELLNRLLAESGIDRRSVYVTNVVKHFHHQVRGKRRLHQRPSARHEVACKPWLEAEVELIRPRVVLALGVTALHALLGRQVKMGDVVGRFVNSWASRDTICAWHPASILRSSGQVASRREGELRAALMTVAKILET